MSEDIKNKITDLNINIIDLKKELEWYRAYGEFIAVNYAHANAEGIEYADKEIE
tara:strand:+ start:79 stop:240 length:162 start_codon:yes stop_codon:yes gene_type:complete